MGNTNRKATKEEMAHLRKVVGEAFPGCVADIGGHGSYGGHRAPRNYTISFRLIDSKGIHRSNVVWILPQYLSGLTAEDVKQMVDRANGK